MNKEIKIVVSKSFALISLLIYIISFLAFIGWFILSFYFYFDCECPDNKFFPRLSFNTFNICDKINCN